MPGKRKPTKSPKLKPRSKSKSRSRSRSPSGKKGKKSSAKSSRSLSSAKSQGGPPDMLNPAAMENLYYIAHGPVDALEMRGFTWPDAPAKKKGKKGKKKKK